MAFDWSMIFGNSIPSEEDDPYGMSDIQRRRILDTALQNLGAGMTAAGFSRNWGDFGMNFSKGIGDYAATQRSEYDRLRKSNQADALFKSNMEQEGLATSKAKLDLEEAEKRKKIDDDFRASVPGIINGLVSSTEELMANAKVMPEDEDRFRMAGQRLKVLQAQALARPDLYLDELDKLTDEIAKISGADEAFQAKKNEMAEEAAIRAGWINQDEAGNTFGDLDGMLKHFAEKRELDMTSARTSIEANRALIGQRDRSNRGDDETGPKPFVPTPPQLRSRAEKIMSAASLFEEYAEAGESGDRQVPITGPIGVKIRAAARVLGINLVPIDEDNAKITPEDAERINSAMDEDLAMDMASKSLINDANRANEIAGRPSVESGKKRGKPSKGEAKTDESPDEQKEGIKTTEYPSASAVKRKIEQDGVSKVIAELKKLGMSREDIKKRYGI